MQWICIFLASPAASRGQQSSLWGLRVLVEGLMGSGPQWYDFPSVPLPPHCSGRQQQNRWGEVEEEEEEEEEEKGEGEIFPLPHFTSGRPRLERQYLQKKELISQSETTFNPTSECQWFLSGEQGRLNMQVLAGRERSVCLCGRVNTEKLQSHRSHESPPATHKLHTAFCILDHWFIT